MTHGAGKKKRSKRLGESKLHPSILQWSFLKLVKSFHVQVLLVMTNDHKGPVKKNKTKERKDINFSFLFMPLGNKETPPAPFQASFCLKQQPQIPLAPQKNKNVWDK